LAKSSRHEQRHENLLRLRRERDVGDVFAEAVHVLHFHAVSRDREDEVVDEDASLDGGGRVRPPPGASGAFFSVVYTAELSETVLEGDVVDVEAAEGHP